MAAEGATLNHISRASSDINRLAKFYQEILGFERIESPKLDFNIIWLSLPPVQIHIIERNPEVNLPERAPTPHLITIPSSSGEDIMSASPFPISIPSSKLSRKRVSKHIESSQPGSKVKQVFFFDPDGNGLEVASRPL
ncbi:unnamed protein product [Rhodiola kirilowii]